MLLRDSALIGLGLQPLMADLEITCFDIGARGGVLQDLLPIASSVKAVGFEPDPAECARLNASARCGIGPWKSLRYIPAALFTKGDAELHLYSQPGCASLFPANVSLAKEFSRDDYFRLEKVIPLKPRRLDDVMSEYGIDCADFIKIDVQGAEIEVFESGRRLLENDVLAIRIEVLFMSLYEGQPLFSDIESYLRGRGFSFVDFYEMHSWRRSTKVKHPSLSRGVVPYSRGSLAHADALFVKHPGRFSDQSSGDVVRLLKLALLASCYEQFDLARSIFQRDGVRSCLRDRYGIRDIDVLLAMYSRLLAKRYWREHLWGSFRQMLTMMIRR